MQAAFRTTACGFCLGNVNNLILGKLFRERVEVAAPQNWGTQPSPPPRAMSVESNAGMYFPYLIIIGINKVV